MLLPEDNFACPNFIQNSAAGKTRIVLEAFGSFGFRGTFGHCLKSKLLSPVLLLYYFLPDFVTLEFAPLSQRPKYLAGLILLIQKKYFSFRKIFKTIFTVTVFSAETTLQTRNFNWKKMVPSPL